VSGLPDSNSAVAVAEQQWRTEALLLEHSDEATVRALLKQQEQCILHSIVTAQRPITEQLLLLA
jgi:hypothetical protein